MGKFAEIKREEEELNLENEPVDEPTDDEIEALADRLIKSMSGEK